MRFLAHLMAVVSFGLIATTSVMATPTEPVEGAEYLRLQNAQPTDTGKKVEVLESKIRRSLSKLPQQFGYSSISELISALQEIEAGERSKKPYGSFKLQKKAAVGAVKRKKRAKVTPEMVKMVEEMVKAEKTGNEIAKTLKVSLPTVQNIKKKLGLVKKR